MPSLCRPFERSNKGERRTRKRIGVAITTCAFVLRGAVWAGFSLFLSVETTIPLGALRYDIGKERLIKKKGGNERQAKMAEMKLLCENNIKLD